MILSNDYYQVIKQIVEWFVVSSVRCVLELKIQVCKSFSWRCIVSMFQPLKYMSLYNCITVPPGVSSKNNVKIYLEIIQIAPASFC